MSGKAYVPEIDGLRAVAVLSVMAYHLNNSLLPGGFTGVDVFFVISGYVVTRSVLLHFSREQSVSWYGHLLGFYARRFRRIVPALLFCLLVTFFINYLLIPESWLNEHAEATGRAAFWGLSNFVLALNIDTYFAPRTEYNPFTHTWSLGVEEQFYVILPLVLIFAARSGLQRTAPFFFPTVITAVLTAISFGFAVYWASANPNWAFYLLPSRFWELGVGSVLCLTQQSWERRNQEARVFPADQASAYTSLQLISGGALIFAGFLLADSNRFPFPWAILPVSGTFFVILAVTGTGDAGKLSTILRSRPLVFVGLISYSLYLWHWPVYVMFRWTTGLESFATMLSAVAGSFALAVISWRFAERPFRERGYSLPSGAVVLMSFVAVLASSQLNRWALHNRSTLSLSVTRDSLLWDANADLTRAPTEGPMLGRKMFVIGNSHSLAYAPMFELAERDLGLEVVMMPDMQCRMGEIMGPTGTDPECLQIRDLNLSKILSAGTRGDIVFFASLRMPRLAEQWVLFPYDKTLAVTRSADFAKGLAQSVAETEVDIEQLERAGFRVLFDLPKPVIPAPTFRCADWFNRDNPICAYGLTIERSKLETLREPVNAALSKIQMIHPQVVIWDPFPALCPGAICSAFDSAGKPLFRDGDHLSGHGNQVLYPSFRQFLLEQLS